MFGTEQQAWENRNIAKQSLKLHRTLRVWRTSFQMPVPSSPGLPSASETNTRPVSTGPHSRENRGKDRCVDLGEGHLGKDQQEQADCYARTSREHESEGISWTNLCGEGKEATSVCVCEGLRSPSHHHHQLWVPEVSQKPISHHPKGGHRSKP